MVVPFRWAARRGGGEGLGAIEAGRCSRWGLGIGVAVRGGMGCIHLGAIGEAVRGVACTARGPQDTPPAGARHPCVCKCAEPRASSAQSLMFPAQRAPCCYSCIQQHGRQEMGQHEDMWRTPRTNRGQTWDVPLPGRSVCLASLGCLLRRRQLGVKGPIALRLGGSRPVLSERARNIKAGVNWNCW